jgi:NitT/TauT family transport system substrate-binding protein
MYPRFFLWLFALLIVSVSSFYGLRYQQSTDTLKISMHPWPGYAFLHVAQSLNNTDSPSLELIDTSSARESVKMLFDGSVDGALLTLDEVLRLREQGLPLTVVLVTNVSMGADHVISKNGPLKSGQTVGVEFGTVGMVMLRSALIQNGLDFSDIQLVDITIDKHISAWSDENLDAIVTFEPTSSHLINLGGEVQFDSRSIPNTIIDVIAVKPDVVSSSPKQIQLLVDTFLAGRKHFFNSPDDAVYRIASWLGVKSVDVRQLYKGLLLPDRKQNSMFLKESEGEGEIEQAIHKISAIETIYVGAALDKPIYTDEFVQ